jgi:hypothetical protein
MFFLSKPAESAVRHFLAAQQFSQFSYPRVGEASKDCGESVENVRDAVGAAVLAGCSYRR